MRVRNNQSGFSIIEIAIVVVVIGIIGFLGYTFYNNQMNKTASDDSGKTSQSATASDVKSAPAVNSVADLNNAETVLDQTDPGGSNSTDADQLDAELSNF